MINSYDKNFNFRNVQLWKFLFSWNRGYINEARHNHFSVWFKYLNIKKIQVIWIRIILILETVPNTSSTQYLEWLPISNVEHHVGIPTQVIIVAIAYICISQHILGIWFVGNSL